MQSSFNVLISQTLHTCLEWLTHGAGCIYCNRRIQLLRSSTMLAVVICSVLFSFSFSFHLFVISSNAANKNGIKLHLHSLAVSYHYTQCQYPLPSPLLLHNLKHERSFFLSLSLSRLAFLFRFHSHPDEIHFIPFFLITFSVRLYFFLSLCVRHFDSSASQFSHLTYTQQ